jgi:predicted hotdog family 3-hydroxylacyl-ACP dehydratase
MLDRDYPLSGEQLYGLLPHTGDMRLIEQVTTWNEHKIKCQTRTHLSTTNPLRRNHQLASIHAAEYGAQAMALHGGLLAQKSGQSQSGGYLVSLRGVKLHTQRSDRLDATLVVQATQLLADSGNMLYDFVLKSENSLIAEGRAAVIVDSEENQ